MARAVHKLMPPIEVIKGSQFNIDKESGELDSFLEAEIAGGKSLDAMETEVIDTPFVQIPLDVLEDRLLGAVDGEKRPARLLAGPPAADVISLAAPAQRRSRLRPPTAAPRLSTGWASTLAPIPAPRRRRSPRWDHP